MRKTITLHDDIEFLTSVPNIYNRSKIANESLCSIRKYVEDYFLTKKIRKEIKLSIGVYDNIEINAFAEYKQNKNYIVLSVGLLYAFYDASYNFVYHENLDKVHIIPDDKKEGFHIHLYFFMLLFIVAHELGHILHGHLLGQTNKKIIEEKYDENIVDILNKHEKWEIQLKEYDADCYASYSITRLFIFLKKNSKKEYLSLIDIIYLSIYLSFDVLSSQRKASFFSYFEKEIDDIDHPHQGIRMFYCLIAVMDLIISNWGLNYITKDLCNCGFHGIIAYEKKVLNKEKVIDSFFYVAQTKKGVQHIMQLVNGWNDRVKKYNQYSYITITKNQTLDKMSYFLDENGHNINNCISLYNAFFNHYGE